MLKRILFVLCGAMLLMVPAGGVAAGGGCGGDLTVGATDRVELSKACFAPTITTVPVGTKVTFVNNDHIPHYVTGAHNEWGSIELGARDTFSHTFSRPGVFPYSCYLHSGMTGAVVVEEEQTGQAPDQEAAAKTEGRVLGESSDTGFSAGPIAVGVVAALAVFVLIIRKMVMRTG